MNDDKALKTNQNQLQDGWGEVAGRVIPGHGVASGRSVESPYPQGSIEMQAPFFKSSGVDLDACFLGTINVSVAPYEFELHSPAITVRGVRWTSIIEPEDFSFSSCELVVSGKAYLGWIYYPRPETKKIHFQPAHMVELIMPYIEDLQVSDEVLFRYRMSEVQLNKNSQKQEDTGS